MKLNKLFNLPNLITVITLIVGYYWYLEQKKERDPTFIREPVKQNILSKKLIEKTPLRILKSTGDEVKTNVYSQTFYFFNQGKESIKKANVLDKISVSFNDTTTEILDFKILKVSRKITNCELLLDSTDRNKLFLYFDILEEDDGLAGQIIYSSASNPDLVINGVVEGATSGFSSHYKAKLGVLSAIARIISFLYFLLMIVLITAAFYYISNLFSKADPKIKKSFFQWLATRYQLIVVNAENTKERTSVTFTYYKIVLFSIAFFTVFLLVSLVLVGTVLDKWFDPRYVPQVEIPITLREKMD